MAVHQRKIDPNGAPVELELVAGFVHVLRYKCVLMKGDGSSQRMVLEGDTIDTQPDRMVLPLPANQLAGLFLAVDGFLSPIRITGKNQRYSLEIHLRQNGATVGEGPVLVSGDMQSTIPILEYVEL
jgi:hypothetical protein